jgi:hypothetical protein
MALGVLAATALMAGPAQAQTTSVGPYYATPSWDQTLPSATRFIILSNFASAAVLDRNTGLVWEKSPQTGGVTWNVARLTCIDKNVGGQKGWRLPSIPELASLVDSSVASPGPTLPPGHPFTTFQSNFYWSASTDADNPALAWNLGFFIGNVFTRDKAFNVDRVWCVRGGMNADAY